MEDMKIIAGPTGEALARGIAEALGLEPGRRELRRFDDGELYVSIEEPVRGADVYLVQPTSPPVEQHLVALLLMADACRRAGAHEITAVMPYFGYARQDRRVRGREPVSARLVAELLATGGLDRVVAVDLHGAGLEAVFPMRLEHLSAVSLLADALRSEAGEGAVVVAPDLGAVKLAERYAKRLGLPTAFVHKQRNSGSRVTVRRVTGEVAGCRPLIVDDMVSTAGTVHAALEALLEAGCEPEACVATTHGLFVGPAVERLRGLPLSRILVTDSVAREGGYADLPHPVEVVGLAGLLAEALGALHRNEPLEHLLSRE